MERIAGIPDPPQAQIVTRPRPHGLGWLPGLFRKYLLSTWHDGLLLVSMKGEYFTVQNKKRQ